ncbi:CDGSH iron-sulfur domain-containing protein [uncultured Maritimibacter sp.]|uniref:CDGSH iron-sulfur domain-containing protein n=1 Tax=uncultured Maritimibacter sp. TaxID=991866 RepID=UPI0025918EE0|nr:CDGSH iron-sulfur domain-containing protein [uncultured Maritimibacter sp.]
MSRATSDEITIQFDGSKCIHARRCVLGLPAVFKPGTPGGWLFPENARAAEIARVIDACPSGALSYTRHDGGMGEQVPPVNTVRLWENGPNELRGDLWIDEAPTTRMLLCRCGQSKNKPFCDNSHVAAGFTATSEPETQDAQETEIGGDLTVTPLPNGPVKIEGHVEVIAASGRQVAVGEKMFLCRCGQSANKPFCDGSHTRAGFTTE